MKPLRPPIPAVPWITEDGFFDPAHFPIDSVLKQAIGGDRHRFQSAVTLLNSMWNHDRKEAGVFLIGLLMTCDDDWEKRSEIVHALRDVQTEPCAKLLFGELKRVKSTNATRRYLKIVIDNLAGMPPSLVMSGFEELAGDNSFTHRMRSIFRAVLDHLEYRQRQGF